MMSADQQYVIGERLSAFVSFDTGAGKYKVYYLTGECRVALSGSFYSARLAWADAAAQLRQLASHTAPLPVEVLDQR